MQSHAPFRFIEFGDIDTDDVGFGNKVTILEEGEKEPVDYYILGPIDRVRSISNDSNLSFAFCSSSHRQGSWRAFHS